ncbi:hypothetical protein Lalb_Chr18g0052421 [Lupinus albus]|uniref:Uncharacterized protein n=1 Tax=Lupinus albus TaxID=3870 RepID=A0A6A4P6K3_LUPAL|nr:hypothetical protein Lalb_Chr18g0052421 [Lupinus albus]
MRNPNNIDGTSSVMEVVIEEMNKAAVNPKNYAANIYGDWLVVFRRKRQA